MTRKLFQERLARLIVKAKEEGLCPVCTMHDLWEALAAVDAAARPTVEELVAHGIGTISLPVRRDPGPHPRETWH
jgi:hypothetical protein